MHTDEKQNGHTFIHVYMVFHIRLTVYLINIKHSRNTKQKNKAWKQRIDSVVMETCINISRVAFVLLKVCIETSTNGFFLEHVCKFY